MFLYALYGSKNLSLKNLHYQKYCNYLEPKLIDNKYFCETLRFLTLRNSARKNIDIQYISRC